MAASSRFSCAVRGWPFFLCLLISILGFLVGFGIDSPFGASGFSRGNDSYYIFLFVDCVRDQQHVLADHADGLPAGLVFDFAILRRDVEWIIESADRRFEADAMFPAVETIFSRIPGEFHGDV